MRSCVVSRERLPAHALLRLGVLPDGTVVLDPKGRISARGAWVRADRATLESVMAQPAPLARAFEQPITPNQVANLLEEARLRARAAALDLLSLSARAGALASGAEQAEATLRGGSGLAVIVADDASPRSVEAILRLSPDLPHFMLSFDRVALGHRIGKGPRSVVVLTRAAPCVALLRQLRQVEALS